MAKKTLTLISTLIILAGLLAACCPAQPPATTEPTTAPAEPTSAPTAEPPPAKTQDLILATTTSTQDSGLLDYLLPFFEEQYDVRVDVIAVGTGQAIELGEKGDADVLLVHARAKEDAFMEAGHGVRREDVMYNDFVIVGPETDPAGIKGMADAAEAFETIAEAQVTFISRGDDSGTHTKEKSIWTAAAIEPSGDWYVSSGLGMGEVLTMADEQQAYTLSDRATYLARTLEGTDLVILVEGDPILFNPYGVIAVNPDKGPHIKAELANTFIDWLVSVPTQEKIGQFGVAEFGAPLFTPDSALWREAHPAAAGAALSVTGAVENELALSVADLEAMGTEELALEHPKKGTQTYEGVRLSKVLDAAKPTGETLTFVAADGYSIDLPLADAQACADCLVAFDEGSLRLAMPEMESALWVKDLVSIEVK
jgi:tungstate transport system substrate-binding protein